MCPLAFYKVTVYLARFLWFFLRHTVRDVWWGQKRQGDGAGCNGGLALGQGIASATAVARPANHCAWGLHASPERRLSLTRALSHDGHYGHYRPGATRLPASPRRGFSMFVSYDSLPFFGSDFSALQGLSCVYTYGWLVRFFFSKKNTTVFKGLCPKSPTEPRLPTD